MVAVAAPSQMPASTYDNNEGARVARTAKAQTIDADVLVGYASVNGTPFYVHEKSPFQQDLDPTALDSAGKLATAATYLGQALASAHALALTAVATRRARRCIERAGACRDARHVLFRARLRAGAACCTTASCGTRLSCNRDARRGVRSDGAMRRD
ncbi:DUF2252 family protein [Pantoea ananatis]|uniref:DUF2252 family protein n=1 Tax=Pantoea ananas TaxID=553 RepID=UPI0022209D18|nr:DUF2252 family protein [Pantoea ananatis]